MIIKYLTYRKRPKSIERFSQYLRSDARLKNSVRVSRWEIIWKAVQRWYQQQWFLKNLQWLSMQLKKCRYLRRRPFSLVQEQRIQYAKRDICAEPALSLMAITLAMSLPGVHFWERIEVSDKKRVQKRNEMAFKIYGKKTYKKLVLPLHFWKKTMVNLVSKTKQYSANWQWKTFSTFRCFGASMKHREHGKDIWRINNARKRRQITAKGTTHLSEAVSSVLEGEGFLHEIRVNLQLFRIDSYVLSVQKYPFIWISPIIWRKTFIHLLSTENLRESLGSI